MRVRIDDKAFEEFKGDNGEILKVTYTNRGEPFREGVDFCLYDPSLDEYEPVVAISLLDLEADRLLNLLCKLRGKKLCD